MRSEVSSRSWRRAGDTAGTGAGDSGGDGIDDGSCRVGGFCGAGRGVAIPESRRTASS